MGIVISKSKIYFIAVTMAALFAVPVFAYVPACPQFSIACKSSELPGGNWDHQPIFPEIGDEGMVHITGSGAGPRDRGSSRHGEL